MSAVWSWVVLVCSVAASVTVVEGGRRLLAGRLSRKWPSVGAVARKCAAPMFASAAVWSANAAMPYGLLRGDSGDVVEHLLRIAGIIATTWLLLRISFALTDPALNRLTRIEGDRNRRARRARTQMMLVRRIAAVVVVIIALGTALFTFPQVRALGAGLLASAGVAGLVVGIAARPSIGNLFAGLQIAFSDALRLDDVVVVEGEWARVEELTLSYVVLRVWDDRRLILPVSYFTDNPFENWTRHSSRITGSVMFHVTWATPVPELRKAMYAYLQDHPLWDHVDWNLQVTDTLPNGLLQLRALVSAPDSATSWDLRCDIREHLTTYLRTHHPEAVPPRPDLLAQDPV